MSQDSVNCNECGLLLDVASTTNFVTCGNCNTPLVVRRTGASIYTERAAAQTDITDSEYKRVVSPSVDAGSAVPTGNELSELRRQQEINRLENQLNRLDLEWEQKKEKYMMTGRYGHRYLPNKGSSVGGGIVVAVFGILWTIFAFGITTGFTWSLSEEQFGPPPIVRILFPLFGVFFVIFGISQSVRSYNKAEQYEQAHERYLSQRSKLFDEMDRVRLQ